MNKPLISVVIVVYNAESTIGHAINSVLQQTYDRIELLIIDGKSTDSTIPVIKSYADKINYFVSEKDEGIYDAMNKGIAAAQGEWVFFLGADDTFYTASVLQEIFGSADLNHIDLLYGDVEFSSNKRRYGAQKNYRQLIEQNICHQAIFYKRRLFQLAGNYNTRYSILADYEMNLRVFGQSRFKTNYISLLVTSFNDKGTSNTNIDRYFHGDMLRHFLRVDKIPYLSPLLQQYHFYFGYVSVFNKSVLTGIRHILTSWITGKRKGFYFLLTGKLFIMNLLYKKIKIK
jgi:glycosyltransferase involved in cell wall biosynthesis